MTLTSKDTSRKKVLLLALSGIGNFIMQSSTITALKKARPDWDLTIWVAPRGTRALANYSHEINQVVELPIKQSIIGHIRQIFKLRQQQFDIGIVLSPGQLLKSATYLYAAGIPRRVAHNYPLGANPTSSLFLTDFVQEKDNTHDIEQNLELLRLFGIDYDAGQPYKLALSAAEIKAANHLFEEYQIKSEKPILALHAGSAPGFTWKRWPQERFQEVARHFIGKDWQILLVGGPEEAQDNSAMANKIGAGATAIQSSLLTTAGVLQLSSVVLANDSGLMHIAAAVGAKTFGIFGPTNEKLTGPRGLQSYVIRAPDTSPVYNTENNKIFSDDSHPTMLAVTTAQVIAVIEKSLDQAA